MIRLRHLLLALMVGFSGCPALAQPIFGPPPSDRDFEELRLDLSNIPEGTIEKADVLNRLADFPGLHPDSAKRYSTEAIQISRKLEYKKGLAKTYQILARQFSFRGEPDSALFYLGQSLDLLKEAGDQKGVISTHERLGIILSKKSRMEEALHHYTIVIEAREEKEDWAGVASVYNHIGKLYYEEGESGLAISNFERSVELYESSERMGGIVRPLVNLAHIYIRQDQFEKARMLLNRGIEIAREHDQGFVRLYVTSGKLYSETGAFDRAKQEFLNAIELSEAARHPEGKIQALHFLAEAELAQGELEDARVHAREALQLMQQFREIRARGVLGILRSLAEIESQSGNYAESTGYLSEALHISDSLFRTENVKAISELQAKYESENKRQEIQLLQSEKKAARLAALLIGFGAIFISGVGGIFFWQKFKKNEERKDAEFQLVKRKMENYGILIAERDSFIGNTVKKLKTLRGHLKSHDSRKELNSILDSLNHNTNIIDSEDKLFERIEHENPVFFKKLDSEFGNLSTRDKRLAALVMMELSAKEIANIMGITAKSVYQAKYRLKKKLEVNSDEQLDKFLKSISQ